jgi:hypothetical protein
MQKIIPLEDFDFGVNLEKDKEKYEKSIGEIKRYFLSYYAKNPMVAEACNASGLLISQFKDALYDDENFRKKFEHLQELHLDKVENHVLKFINIDPVIETEEGFSAAHPLARESLKAAEILLKAKAKHRGYGASDLKQVEEIKDNKIEIIVVNNESNK